MNKSGKNNTAEIGMSQAIEAIAKGPAPKMDNRAVVTGRPNMTTIMMRLLVLRLLMTLVAASLICAKSKFSANNNGLEESCSTTANAVVDDSSLERSSFIA